MHKPFVSPRGKNPEIQRRRIMKMPVRLKPFFLIIALFLISSTFFPLSHGQDAKDDQPSDGAMSLLKERLDEAGSGNASFVLAKKETYRKDPLDNFNFYTGGWNIASVHYLASVAFSSAPFAIIAIAWFVLFGLFLFCACICCCCCRRNKPYGYSRLAYALSLIFLVLFTIAAIVGCVIMYIGEGRFQGSVNGATKYIVNQGISVVNNLINVYNYLSSAKNIALNQQFLPPDLVSQIDKVNSLINATGNLPHVTSAHITDSVLVFLNPVNMALITITVFLLLLAFLGFLFSILGMQACVYLFVVIGWIIITLTFILCGIFLVFHNIVADTCVAMDEWVQNPMADSAMKELLPCWDRGFGQNVLNASRSVTTSVDGLLNEYIVLVANNDTLPPETVPLYHNQSGPLVPVLCNPYTTQQGCGEGEVALSDAAEEWKKYVCEVSAAGICTTIGRLTPDMYNQMTSAVNVSYGLHNYGHFLAGIVDCTVLRDTFNDISQNHCPGLRKYSEWVYIGLVTATGSVMLSLILWVLYARERRHRKYTKRINKGYDESPLVGGRKL
ncbi:uncharacterized protein LOC110427203 isoform X2 [Herrania umbratica]|uniref:Uncharacterized protein LOC110427203 isoform X2 n=1 Tax=Herrania umbratica TaxID=108875 RepID=A0A6J1BFY4_9ROSI|nr:uncharacterized protein LOC110427203 isoform X2 [Herrania umbratica]